MPQPQMKCPSCKTRDVSRSRTRNAAERVLKWVMRIVPFRCRNCDRRFFSFSAVLQQRAA